MTTINNFMIFIFSLLLIIFHPIFYSIYAHTNKIIVVAKADLRIVNEHLFGSNVLGYDPVPPKFMGHEYFGYSDFGAGIWDGTSNISVEKVINLAQKAGLTILRFPGGCGVHMYEWRNAIGKDRGHFLYGIDEFLTTCHEIGAEAILTVSYFTGDESDKADLVEYLNSPNDGSNPGGGVDWARERARNGRDESCNVKYFEIGNEVWHGNHQDIRQISPDEYANRYLKYYGKMKMIDPSIQIGVVLYDHEWNSMVMEIIKNKIDFGIMHTYPSPRVNKSQLQTMDAKEIYRISLAMPIIRDEKNFEETLVLLREKSGKSIPLAITEYNGGFVQEKPVPYRHCLGTSLLNAELLRIFMKPEHNILMANYWNFVNEYWGMIANGFDGTQKTLYNPYYKRPNYYVFEMYHKYFGDMLIRADVLCDSYKIQGKDIPYLSVNASKSSDGSKVYLMVINKNLDDSVTSAIEIKDFMPAKDADAWILNGPSVDATNEKDHNNVKVTHKEFKIEGNTFEFTFEPHSLTAIELERK